MLHLYNERTHANSNNMYGRKCDGENNAADECEVGAGPVDARAEHS